MKGIGRFLGIIRVAARLLALAILLVCAYEPCVGTPEVWEDIEVIIGLAGIIVIPLALATGLFIRAIRAPKGRKLRSFVCSFLAIAATIATYSTITIGFAGQRIDELYWHFNCSASATPMPSNRGVLTCTLLSCLVTYAIARFATPQSGEESQPER